MILTNVSRCRECFARDNSIFIPAELEQDPGRWIPLSSCVWNGPNCLRSVERLKRHYNGLSRLFRQFLEVPDTDIWALYKEAQALESYGAKLDHVKSVLRAISQSFESDYRLRYGDEGSMPDFASCKMFPVMLKGRATSETGNYVLKSSHDTWVISDRPDLRDLFEKAIHVSVMSAATFRTDIYTLYDSLGLRSHLLSEMVTCSESKITGDALCDQHTTMIRERAIYIAWYVQPAAQSWSNRRLTHC